MTKLEKNFLENSHRKANFFHRKANFFHRKNFFRSKKFSRFFLDGIFRSTTAIFPLFVFLVGTKFCFPAFSKVFTVFL